MGNSARKTNIRSTEKSKKKINPFNSSSILKHLNHTLCRIMSTGTHFDFHVCNTILDVKIAAGLVAGLLSIYAQFFAGEYPHNRTILIFCVAVFCITIGSLELFTFLVERNAIVYVTPGGGSFKGRILRFDTSVKKEDSSFTLQVSIARYKHFPLFCWKSAVVESVDDEILLGELFTEDGQVAEKVFELFVLETVEQLEKKIKTE